MIDSPLPPRHNVSTLIRYLLIAMTLGSCTSMPKHLGIKNDGHLASCPSSPNCVWSGAKDKGHSIEAFRYGGDRSGAMSQMEKLILEMRRTRLIKREGRYLHFTFTSALFRFVDDVEMIFAEGGEVEVRSASRMGHSDLGANRERIEVIRKKWKN